MYSPNIQTWGESHIGPQRVTVMLWCAPYFRLCKRGCACVFQSTTWFPNLVSASSQLLSSGAAGLMVKPAATTRCTWTSPSGTRASRRKWRRWWRTTVPPKHLDLPDLWRSTQGRGSSYSQYTFASSYVPVFLSFFPPQASTPSWSTWLIKIFSSLLILRFDFWLIHHLVFFCKIQI